MRLVSLLLSVEDIHADMRENGEDDEEVLNFAKNLEHILSEFAASQQTADRMIIGLTPLERKAFIEEVPEVLDLFGWHDKFDEDGNIMGED